MAAEPHLHKGFCHICGDPIEFFPLVCQFEQQITALPNEIEYEDNHTHAILELESMLWPLYFRVLSESETDPPDHSVIESMLGHRVRITLEILDDRDDA